MPHSQQSPHVVLQEVRFVLLPGVWTDDGLCFKENLAEFPRETLMFSLT